MKGPHIFRQVYFSLYFLNIGGGKSQRAMEIFYGGILRLLKNIFFILPQNPVAVLNEPISPFRIAYIAVCKGYQGVSSSLKFLKKKILKKLFLYFKSLHENAMQLKASISSTIHYSLIFDTSNSYLHPEKGRG